MQLFLISSSDHKQGQLSAGETRHSLKVLRHQIGEEIHGIDGKGNYYRARLKAVIDQQAQLEILEHQKDWGEAPGRLVLAIAPLRLKDRFEWAIEKAVELGVTEIYPIQTQRVDPYKSKFKPERLRTIMVTAMKQCKRSRLPLLHDRLSWQEFLAHQPSLPNQKYLAWCEAEAPLSERVQAAPFADTLLVIGPEGDFSPEEIQQAQQKDFQLVSLGSTRLRTETAALYALSLLKARRDA
ncbi:MAG: RsmE family RNA methyltransferase [Bacteroidota bacterium]